MDQIYQKFVIETANYEHPTRYGKDWFLSALDKLWDAIPKQVDWLGFEQFVRDVLSSRHLTNSQKMFILGEAVGAFTGRGGVIPMPEAKGDAPHMSFRVVAGTCQYQIVDPEGGKTITDWVEIPYAETPVQVQYFLKRMGGDK
jgi:hypothetical protein